MRGHKSTAYNPNDESYNYHLYKAIRKYGWNNFSKEIIEEIPEEKSQEFLDDRERYYIALFGTLNPDVGYNKDLGGQGGQKKPKHTFEERVKLSKLFTLEEVVDIQNLLKEGSPMEDIKEKYSPKLSSSMLANINIGINFKNDSLEYPLHNYSNDGSRRTFSFEEQDLIRQDIINGELTYKEIADKWGIASLGLISQINNGKAWRKEGLEYPLSIRGNSKLHNYRDWVKPVQQDLLSGKMSIGEIAEKYNKSYGTIKKINQGLSYHDDKYSYPLKKRGKPKK